MNRQAEVTNWHRMLIAMLGIVAGIFWVMAMGYNLNYFYVAAGSSILLVTLLPIAFSTRYDWFCPWTSLILAVIYGCFLPSVCMSLNLPSEEFVHENILLGKTPDFFIFPTFLIFLFVVFMGIGFFYYPAKPKPIPVNRTTHPGRLLLVCSACGAVSIMAFAAYFFLNGGLSGGISSKRGTISTLDVGADSGFRQYGYLRHFAKLGNIGLLLLAAYWSRYRPPARSFLAMLQMMILAALIMVSIAFPFYSSSRAAIMWVIIGYVGCLYYMDQKIVTTKTVLVSAAIVVLLMFVTVVRNNGLESKDSLASRIGRVLINRHGPDIAVTSHVVQNIPHKLDFQFGKTIAVWAVAPVPREIMPNKPLIHSGPIIGQRIYKLEVSGVPPGGPAELYWNFHVPGVIIGSLIFGALMRLVYQLFINIEMDAILLAPIYLFSVFPIAFKAATHSIGISLVMPMVDLVTACAVAYFVSVAIPRIVPTQIPQRHHQQPTGPIVATTSVLTDA